MSFVHLHVHTEYSLLDGLSRIPKLFGRAKELNMPAVALTDHGVMFGAIEFYTTAQKYGVKPIIGCELYVAPRGRTDRDPEKDRSAYHLTVLAHNLAGYRNLCKLASIAQLEGFYYKPRVDKQALEQYSEGLIILSGCPSSEIMRAIRDGQTDAAKRSVGWFRDVFPGRFFVELQQHEGYPELGGYNRELVALARAFNLPLVATNDVHYVRQEDAAAQDMLVCIQTSSIFSDPNRMRMSDQSYYLKTAEEMAALFSELPEALANTLAIAEMCDLKIELGKYHLPPFDVPPGYTAASYVRHLCDIGFERNYPVGHERRERATHQLTYELGVINQMGFDTYFLIVWDLCRFARENGIWWNVRGSAAGSLVSYCMGLTQLDPLKYGLIFERFLNPGRVSMPDIDLDFPDDQRQRMIEYTVQKYGSDRVAQIITFGTLGARAAIRDVGRALEVSLPDVDRIARLVPAVPGKPVTIANCLDSEHEFYSADLKQLYDSEAGVHDLLERARALEGVARHASTHAAGVVVADRPLSDYAPLHRPTKGNGDSSLGAVVQYDMGYAEQIGLLKIDFLGLSTLTILRRTIEYIKARRGIELELADIPLDDPKIYELLSSGQVLGVFQVEGCLSGETYVGSRMIKDLYRDYLAQSAAGPQPWAKRLKTESCYLDSGKLVANEIIKVIYSGVKPVYRLTDERGTCIKATADHHFLTQRGWVRLGDLDVATDRVLIKPKTPVKIQPGQANLERSQSLQFPRETALANIRSIEYVGKEATYDLQMRAPGNNFVANGFVVHNSGMRQVLTSMRPSQFEHIIAVLSLYRPGPMEYIPTYIKRMHGEEAVEYKHPKLAPILGETYGICVSGDAIIFDPLTGRRCRLDEAGTLDTLHIQGVTADLAPAVGRVTHWISSGRKPVYKLTLRNGASIKTTAEHRFLTEHGWRELQELRPGERVAVCATETALPSVSWEPIDTIEPASIEDVYDLTVEGLHNFVANNIIVHNCVYQEQIIQIASQLAGYSPGDADQIRKAVGKKMKDKIEEHRVKFVKGAAANDIPEETSLAIYADIEFFARYGFNKSHAADYAVVTCHTAYLKAHYPVEYMTALMDVESGDTEKIGALIAETRRLGIAVLPPNVNYSQADFAIEDAATGPGIRYGLAAVKNVGEGPVATILAARQSGGPFRDLADFCRRVDVRQVNRRVLESLMKVDAFRDFGRRAPLLAMLDRMMAFSTSEHRAAESGQLSLFGASPAAAAGAGLGDLPSVADTPRREEIEWEKELVGTYLGEHPLQPVMEKLQSVVTIYASEIDESMKDRPVTVAGLVSSVRRLITKKGDPMAFVMLEDLTGIIEITVFPRLWKTVEAMLKPDELVIIAGKVDTQGKEPKLIADRVSTSFTEVRSADHPTMRPGRRDARGLPLATSGPAPTRAPGPGTAPPPAPTAPAARPPTPPAILAGPTTDTLPPPDDDDTFATDDFSVPPPDEPPDWLGLAPARVPHAPPTATPPPAPPTPVAMTPPMVTPPPAIPPSMPPVAITPMPPHVPTPPPASTPTRPLTPPAEPLRASAPPRETPLPPAPIPPAVPPTTIASPVAARPAVSGVPGTLLTITLKRSGNLEYDKQRMRTLHDLLMRYPGTDRFRFVLAGDRTTVLDFPNNSTGYCAALAQQIEEMLGPDSIALTNGT